MTGWMWMTSALASTLWYPGDGDPSWFGGGYHSNIEWVLLDRTEMVFEDCEVPAPGWQIDELWSNNVTNARHAIVEARWEIRRDLSVGLAGAGAGGT